MTTDTEKEVAQLELFKILLLSFIENKFHACSGFITQFKLCKDEKDIVKLFVKYADDVYEKLGGNSSELHIEIDKLENKVRRLNNRNDELEEQLENEMLVLGDTLTDEYKRIFIHQYHNNYTPWELEELLKNGKEYLKNGNK